IQEFYRLLLIRIAGEIHDKGNALQRRIWFCAALKQHIDLPGVDPVGPLSDHAVEALTDAIDLVALHREEYIRGGGEAGYEFELRADESVERLWIGIGPRANAGIADDQFLLQQILERLHLGACHRNADIGLRGRRSNPGDLERIEARARGARQ